MEDEDDRNLSLSPPPFKFDYETLILSNLATNHLFLTQFEAFRAIILTLRRTQPEVALSFLQTVVAHGGNFSKNQVFSPNCPSPALLAWVSSIEMFQFDNPTSIWGEFASPELVRVQVEFLLYVQMVVARVWDGVKRRLGEIGVVWEDTETGFEEKVVGFENEGELREFRGEIRVLHGFLEVGLRRLKEGLIVSLEERGNVDDGVVEEDDLRLLRRVILENSDVFRSICEIVQKQVGQELEVDDGGSGSGLAITLREGTVSSVEDQRVLKSLLEYVQVVHLEEIKGCVEKEDVDGAISHIRYLHLGYGVAEDEYR